MDIDPIIIAVAIGLVVLVTYTPADRYLPQGKVADEEVDVTRWRHSERDGNRRVVEDSSADEILSLIS